MARFGRPPARRQPAQEVFVDRPFAAGGRRTRRQRLANETTALLQRRTVRSKAVASRARWIRTASAQARANSSSLRRDRSSLAVPLLPSAENSLEMEFPNRDWLLLQFEKSRIDCVIALKPNP